MTSLNINRQKAALVSVLASIFIFAVKTSAFYITNSTAVFSDALESIVNVIAAIVALLIIRIVEAPADTEHPYGHGKLEYFSSAFEGGLIFFAALTIIFQSVSALFKKEALHQIDLGLVIIIIAALFNLGLGYYLKREGEKENSEALKASAEHVFSDVWTTGGVIIGLLLVKLTGLLWLDPLAAILVASNLAFTGYKIIMTSIDGLIDAANPKVISDLAVCLNNQKKSGIIDIHQLRMIRAGRFHHVDAHVVVPEFWDIKRAHDETDSFARSVVKEYHFDGEIAFHLDPCRQFFCTSCEIESCNIRKEPLKNKKIFTSENIIDNPDPNYIDHE